MDIYSVEFQEGRNKYFFQLL